MRVLMASVLVLSTSSPAWAETPTRGSLEIETERGEVTLAIEIADEPNERSQGLMFRESLPENSGMLFIYPAPRIASFWMKNTRIPLDMLFIDVDGEITSIARETVPFSLTPVRSTEPVKFILEIDGGDADRLGIAVGDRMTWEVDTPSE